MNETLHCSNKCGVDIARTLCAAVLAALAGLTMLPASVNAGANASCAPAPRSALTVNVREKGAKGDGRSNDTAAIQAAIDAVAGKGGTVIVPDGRYMVEATGKAPLRLGSDMTLRLAPKAILKVIPNAAEVYTLLSVAGASNVAIEGGTLEGDRKEHQGKTGEWGMGVRIDREASNVVVSGTTISRMWGDGIYVARARNVTLCHVTAHRNRRQGLSVIAVDGLTVMNSIFRDTTGTRPSAGIDFEPNDASETIKNVRIENSKFIDNAGPGILIAGKKGEISGLTITSNVFEGSQPIVIEDAREVSDRAICKNRHVTRAVPQAAGGLSTNADPIPFVIVQDECGDRRIVVRRGKQKKN